MSDELDPAMRSLLDECNAADALPDPVRARVWSRVETATAVPVAAPIAAATWVKPTVVAFALAAGVSALWFGGNALRESPRVADGAAAYEHREVELEPATAGAIEMAPADPTVVPAEIPAVDTAPTPAPPPPDVVAPTKRSEPRPRVITEEAPPAKPTPVVDEIGRLRDAQAALRHDPVRTLELLDALDRDAPKGVMIPERAALRVFATCATGDEGRARKLAAKFADRHATSPLLDRVRSTCAPEEKSIED
jgi:hypothetical protein